MRKEQRRKRRKKKSLIKRFFTVLFSIVLIYVIAFGSYIGYTYLNDDENDNYFASNSTIIPSVFIPKVPERTNFLVMGVDGDETRTDTIMVGSFNSVAKELSVMSIPRDTIVEVPEERYKIMKENVPRLSSNKMKINAVHAYGGKKHGNDFAVKQVEDLLDIEIDYYGVVNCEAFRYIVDSIGGVPFNVEQNMRYDDPVQDLHINLKAGQQVLDGDMAEQLVRFRYGYAQQDLHRVEVQQEFIKAFIATALSKENIMGNPTAYLTAIVKYVDTNAGVTDAVKYIKYLSDFSTENFKSYTLPGYSETLDGLGSSYIMDEEEAEKVVYEMFKKPANEISTGEQTSVEEETSKDKTIQVLNGGYTVGIAGKTKKVLEKDGFVIDTIGDYTGQKKEKTRIFVNKEGHGKDLIKYFEDAEVVVDSSETNDYDIVIVIGTSEKNIGDNNE